MQGNNNKEVLGLWFNRANDDELSAKSILKHRDGAPNSVCSCPIKWEDAEKAFNAAEEIKKFVLGKIK